MLYLSGNKLSVFKGKKCNVYFNVGLQDILCVKKSNSNLTTAYGRQLVDTLVSLIFNGTV